MSVVGDDDKVPWRQMGILRLLSTLGGVAATLAVLAFITCSSATGFGLLWAVLIAWMALAAVMGMAAPAAIVVIFVVDLLLIFVNNDEVKDKVYLWIRWVVFMVGMVALIWIGGRGIVDGFVNNRMVEPQVLYQRCMQPQTRTVQDQWRECSDGWGSPSIGRRGACSHHGGVVWRTIERKERYQPHNAAYCRADAAARSWLD